MISCDAGDTISDQLLSAAERGNINEVKSLLEQGANINYQSPNMLSTEETPCAKAAKNGHLEVLDYLISQGADCQKATSGGENPITLAAKENQQAAVLFLIENGSDVNYQEKNFGKTPLLSAVEWGDLKFIKRLISLGASLNTRDKSGNTPLTLAAFRKHPEIVEFLAKSGASMKATGLHGRPPISLALISGSKNRFEIQPEVKATVDVLLKFGADINQQDSNGDTPLIYAASKGNKALMDYLIGKGANPDIANNNGATASEVYRLNR